MNMNSKTVNKDRRLFLTAILASPFVAVFSGCGGEICKTCDGKGKRANGVRCTTCGGRGRVDPSEPCTFCGGSGSIPFGQCGICGGTGKRHR